MPGLKLRADRSLLRGETGDGVGGVGCVGALFGRGEAWERGVIAGAPTLSFGDDPALPAGL